MLHYKVSRYWSSPLVQPILPEDGQSPARFGVVECAAIDHLDDVSVESYESYSGYNNRREQVLTRVKRDLPS